MLYIDGVFVSQMNPSESPYLCTSRRLKTRRDGLRDSTEPSLVASPPVILTRWALKKVSDRLTHDLSGSVTALVMLFLISVLVV